MEKLSEVDKKHYEKIIKALRVFFTTGSMAFELQAYIVQTVSGKQTFYNNIQRLFALGKFEMDKENPNLEYIDGILEILEKHAELKEEINKEINKIPKS